MCWKHQMIIENHWGSLRIIEDQKVSLEKYQKHTHTYIYTYIYIFINDNASAGLLFGCCCCCCLFFSAAPLLCWLSLAHRRKPQAEFSVEKPIGLTMVSWSFCQTIGGLGVRHPSEIARIAPHISSGDPCLPTCNVFYGFHKPISMIFLSSPMIPM